MTYKVINYKCGCKYIWLNGSKRSVNCPIHKRPVSHYILWCVDCNLKVKTSSQAGYRQIMCGECAKERQRKVAREFYVNNPGYTVAKNQAANKQRMAQPKKTLGDIDREAVEAWFQDCRGQDWQIPTEVRI